MELEETWNAVNPALGFRGFSILSVLFKFLRFSMAVRRPKLKLQPEDTTKLLRFTNFLYFSAEPIHSRLL